ncbi:hypothetical protein VISI1226_09959 [Vibrio sinaloensis DSM 21326]|uniref:HD-GYP domain-containing protein n=1 Tax=Vibrio sinaloensis DSM 21326 TaxID=945550 RepID=E8M860_PHOS4|nr:HD domain-containing phosphohydrolase [Vibrio sinaloensis]EGA69752.1 hypothetical protein VISI1226_09959 [Vibrio sinaloensis DSM 21326]
MLLRRLFLILFCALSSVKVFSAEWQAKHILVLHSYEPSYHWTSDFQRGIEAAAAQLNQPVKFSLEYLDTKRLRSANYLREFQRYYSVKYQDVVFDGVLITDDNALNMVNQWQNSPIARVPIVAGGINDLSARLNTAPSISKILYERDDLQGTLAMISALRPQLSNLYFVTDDSHTAGLVRESFVEELQNSELADIPLTVIENQTLQETANTLAKVSSSDAIILSHYNTELDSGTFHSYEAIASRLAQSTSAPIFVFWEFYITGGVVGGYVNRSEQIGQRMVVELAHLLGLTFDSPLIVQGGKRAVVDYQAIERHALNLDELTGPVLVLNEPESELKENLHTIGYSMLSFVCLSIVIVSQSRTIRQKRELNDKNRKIVALQRKTLDVQKQMIHVLGEAIETRSGETGNHVKRVAKLSAHLAKLYGLSHREVEMLEIISPMHDVGKIAIPETILDKPGKLTPDEWAIMQTHTHTGHKLLSSSKGEIFQLAAIVALQHHEKWDGNGYPDGIAGEKIHIFARITAIADVFDALLSVRCYKRAWSLEQVMELFREQSGQQFDPELTELLLRHLDEFVEIRRHYPDHIESPFSIAS